MRVVFDTNVFVSALLWGGKPRELLQRIIEGKDILYISRPILAELHEVLLRPKFGIDEDHAELFIREVEDISEIVPIKERIHALCRDVDDNAIVECAVAGGAEYLISGDEDLLALRSYRKIRIMSASDFLVLPPRSAPPSSPRSN